ncbi:hypothetical protein GW750_08125 [bacterium]|nr:hypothetical protein [bacterium]
MTRGTPTQRGEPAPCRTSSFLSSLHTSSSSVGSSSVFVPQDLSNLLHDLSQSGQSSGGVQVHDQPHPPPHHPPPHHPHQFDQEVLLAEHEDVAHQFCQKHCRIYTLSHSLTAVDNQEAHKPCCGIVETVELFTLPQIHAIGCAGNV